MKSIQFVEPVSCIHALAAWTLGKGYYPQVCFHSILDTIRISSNMERYGVLESCISQMTIIHCALILISCVTLEVISYLWPSVYCNMRDLDHTSNFQLIFFKELTSFIQWTLTWYPRCKGCKSRPGLVGKRWEWKEKTLLSHPIPQPPFSHPATAFLRLENSSTTLRFLQGSMKHSLKTAGFCSCSDLFQM